MYMYKYGHVYDLINFQFDQIIAICFWRDQIIFNWSNES